ncbi:glycosyltransferase family 2 protein [candidate division WWE3 bacterium]|nr:glycosyltransferase family 2 protein [candidate division WWE3 bacterium]
MPEKKDITPIDQPHQHKDRLERALEMLPGVLTWFALTSPVWLSFRLPNVMAFIIIFLDVYWLYRVVKSMILSITGYLRMRESMNTDWHSRLESDFGESYKEINHILIIPSHKEPGYVIKTTLEAIAKSDYPLDKIHVILALEKRDLEELKKDKQNVAKEYEKIFAGMYVTEHPDDIEGEAIGPGSNRTWSLKHLMPQLEKKINIDKTILTTLDADFAIHHRFLASLTHKYLSTDRPEQKSFSGVFVYSNNYWQAPTPMRLIASALTLGQLGELVENWKYVNFSSHSINLRTLIRLDYWTIDHIADDTFLYWKAFYEFKGDYMVIPHWGVIYGDTVLDETLVKTMVNQYKQLQRWAYGVEHMPYIIKQTFFVKEMSVWVRFERLLYAVRSYLFWAVVAFLTGVGAIIITVINPLFGQTVLGQNLAIYSSLILTVAILGLIPTAYLNTLIAPPMPKEWSPLHKLWGHIQIVISPVVLMTFGSVPAIDSQTRLMLGKYLTFRVTNKHRTVSEIKEKVN